MMGTLSMWSDTCDILRCHGMRQFVQPHTLLQYQLGWAMVSRSSDHVLRFPCRKREGRRGRHCVFSRWVVSGDSR